MRKRILAGLLTVALALSLLPMQTLAASGVPYGYHPIYTLEDLLKAGELSNAKLFLMNDIDASAEGNLLSGGLTSIVVDSFHSGSVFDGNGHTIYGSKYLLFGSNFGTIRNLNVSIHDTPDDAQHLLEDAPTRDSDTIVGICWENKGTIENCNVRMTLDKTSDRKAQIGGVCVRNSGTIRDCIALFDVDLTTSGTMAFGGICAESYGYDNDVEAEKTIDHCLVLGRVALSFNDGADTSTVAGLTHLRNFDALSIVDSACALETLSAKNAQGRFALDAGFTKFMTTKAPATNCRAANDMEIRWTEHGTTSVQDGTIDSANDCTLDSRENILKDWDLSGVPGETPSNGGTTTDPKPSTPEPEPGPAPAPKPDVTPSTEPSTDADRIEFHFEGNSGRTQTWRLNYADDYFYSQDNGYNYNPDLAKASLCLEMSSFSTNTTSTWGQTASVNTTLLRTLHVRELLQKLGFDMTSYQAVNYDVPLTDTSDKVAYSMAMKYITNEDGGTDTLLAVPIRGGGYGGEWASNFHVSDRSGTLSGNHYGFDTAANGVLNGLSNYVANHEIKGDLKIWAVGFSRGAAVANLLGRKLNNAVLGSIKPNVCDIYVYTFATPAGASRQSSDQFFDPNIYNIISPVDLVPRVAPSAWGYTRYGTTLTLPYDKNSSVWNRFKEISSITTTSGISSSQRALLDHFCADAFTIGIGKGNVFGIVPYSDVQETIMDFAGKKLGAAPSIVPTPGLVSLSNTLREVLSEDELRYIIECSGTKYSTVLPLIPKLGSIGLAHYPEHYLARLEADNLQSEDDFLMAVRNKRAIIIYPPADKQIDKKVKDLQIKVDFWNVSGTSVGSYANGVCKSGDVTLEMTEMGLIATLPDGANYTVTVSGADADLLSATFYSYEAGELEPARNETLEQLPVTDDSSCTIFVPEDDYDDFYVEDADGIVYYPGDDITPLVNFTDVPAGAYYADAVKWAVAEGITSGTSPTTFSPNNGCTRAQMVTFLWRAAGSPEPESDYEPFRDVPKDAYYRKAVLWAAGEGITSGTSPTTFSPNATVTRAQTVTFLWRWEGEPEADQRSGFRDVPAGQYYSEAVSWAVEAGITNGTGTTTFSPGQTCTRAQIVTFLWRDMA